MRLFSLFGFAVSVDASWLLLAVLVSWSLAASLFPSITPGLPLATYWAMGVVTTLGLFASIVFHETAHAVVARRNGVTVKSVTLWMPGGVTELAGGPPSPGRGPPHLVARPGAAPAGAAGLPRPGAAPRPVTMPRLALDNELVHLSAEVPRLALAREVHEYLVAGLRIGDRDRGPVGSH